MSCLNYNTIINDGGLVTKHVDGTVSVFVNYAGVLTPHILTKACCENLGSGYTFNINTQTCSWGTNSFDTCNLDPFNITLNTNGNDGSLFFIDNDQDCGLNISFDYLFNLKYGTLSDILNSVTTNPVKNKLIIDVAAKTEELNIEIANFDSIYNRVIELQTNFDSTRYSIACDGTPSTIYCLSEPQGVEKWFDRLGNKFDRFIDGDVSSYTCSDVNYITSLEEYDEYGDLITFFTSCQTPLGTKTNLTTSITQELVSQSSSEAKLSILRESLALLEAKLDIENSENPTTLINVFETLDVSVSLDVVTSGNTLQTVYTENIFPAIGVGNLYNYVTGIENTGFYLSGGISGTESVDERILSDLFIETGLSATTENYKIFTDTVKLESFKSDWLKYNILIDDVDVIDLIKDKKIKITLNINDSSSNFCIYLDNIVLDRVCTIFTGSDIYLSKSPGFKLDRIHDNKKSWVSDSKKDRNFSIGSNNGLNAIRHTNYNVSDERLIINTKEIDLDINLASAIETDVWSYIKDNQCILTGTENCDNCIEKCCGDNKIDFIKLMAEALSDITTVDGFNHLMLTELIDVKSRQTLSGYPTLKALYDRYLNSENYCLTTSSKFDYLTVNEFAGLIGDYWVDIVEQVMPATTIWGSVRVYTNTIFDQQKFKYRAYSSIFCANQFQCENVPSPINGKSGMYSEVGVTTTVINKGVTVNNVATECDRVYISQMNSGSEFIGAVKVVNANNEIISEMPTYDRFTVVLVKPTECDVLLGSMTAKATGGLAPYTYEWSNGETTETAEALTDGSYYVIVSDSHCESIRLEFDYMINLCSQKNYQDGPKFSFQDGDNHEFMV